MILPLRKPQPETVAAVDLGSNSFHMIVCRIQNDQLKVVDRLREMVRLAAGIDDYKHLSEEAQQRALSCLMRFGQRIRDLPHRCVRIVGTNTLRSIRDSEDFIQQAEEALGHPIDIISGVEEARLIYLGVAHSLAADQKRRLVMDIGGGSTELIIGEQFEPIKMESLYMGCVSMSRRFFNDGNISRKIIKKAEIAAQMELEPVISRYQHYNWDEAIGASGTIRAVIKIAQANGWAEHRITLESMQHIIDTMCEAAHIDQLQLKGLDPERAPVFPGGIIILYATFKALGIKEMRVADGALREGLIHDQLGRFHDEDVRSKSVSSLAQRYHVDKDQVTRVQHTVRNCFEQVANNWKLDEENHLQWLLWAVELYEIGMDIAHSHHQKHSAYIIENTDLAGFSRQEQSVLASLVLAHRRKFPLKTFKRLSTQWKKVAQRLAILLRLATVLHRSHTDIALPEFTLKVNGKLLQLSFENHWLDEHQLTLADLQQEAIYLENTGYKLELNDV